MESAHLLINELYGKDVDVKVIARRVILPTTPVSAAVSAILRDALPTARIVDVMADTEDGLMFSATIQDVAPPSAEVLTDSSSASAACRKRARRLKSSFSRF